MQNLASSTTAAQVKKLVDLAKEEKIARRLDFIYGRVPMNDCQRCADCCFTSPQVHQLEFLNIYDSLRSLPELEQRRLGRKLVEYEILSLATLKNKCPFLRQDDCLIYERRPLQCRLFGLYPLEEYTDMVAKCRRQNEDLAGYYARAKGLSLSEDVMTYDIDQCANNIDRSGKAVVVAAAERDRLNAQISELGRQVLPDHQHSSGLVNFSNYYVLTYLEDEFLEDAKVKAIREFQKNGRSRILDDLLTGYNWRF